MYSYGSPHMVAQKQDDQLERTFSSYVRIQAVVLKTYLGRWTIGRSGERGSGISVLPARYDDDDDGDIYPSHIQQCLNLTMHFSLRHLAAKMLSPLHNKFISFPYFFPSYETCSINVNSLFYAAIKNLHIKANGIFVFFILLYFTTTLRKGITHTCKNTFLH